MPLERINRKTGLYNQELMEVLLQHEIARVERYPIPLALARIAVEFGNKPTYDVVEGARMAVAHILNSNLRVADVPGHFDSDYLVILPVTDEAGAKVVASRLNKLLFATHPLRNGGQLELTSFIGITAIPQGTTISQQEFLGRATRALAVARKRAPGSIVVFSEVTQTGPMR